MDEINRWILVSSFYFVLESYFGTMGDGIEPDITGIFSKINDKDLVYLSNLPPSQLQNLLRREVESRDLMEETDSDFSSSECDVMPKIREDLMPAGFSSPAAKVGTNKQLFDWNRLSFRRDSIVEMAKYLKQTESWTQRMILYFATGVFSSIFLADVQYGLIPDDYVFTYIALTLLVLTLTIFTFTAVMS